MVNRYSSKLNRKICAVAKKKGHVVGIAVETLLVQIDLSLKEHGHG